MNTRFFSRLMLVLAMVFFSACGGPQYHSRVLHSPENSHLKGHQKPYVVNGKRYRPLLQCDGFVQKGVASWYGEKFHGRKTSNGETYNMYDMTAAHKTLPMGVFVRVTNRENGRQVVVRVNDRGPFVDDRIIDLSYAAAKQLGVVGPGTARVRVEVVAGRVPPGREEQKGPVPSPASRGRYVVQVGAFSGQGNASRLASELQGKYGSADVVSGTVNGRTFYRVRAGNYSSRDAAEAARDEFRKTGYPGSIVVGSD